MVDRAAGHAGLAPRSYLYVPGDRADFLAKAADQGADAVIVDLEDGVVSAAKDRARRTAREWIERLPPEGPSVWVRVNPETVESDVAATVRPGTSGIVLPKADKPGLDRADRALAEVEDGSRRLPIVALVETAAVLADLASVARHSRVSRLGMGEADLAGELGIEPDRPELTLSPLRLWVAVASAAAGITRPVGAASRDFRDLEALRESTRTLLHLGFRARTAIHPAQVRVINEVFTPAADEVERARELLARFADAVGEERGVMTDDRGVMVDLAVVRSAREVLQRAAWSTL